MHLKEQNSNLNILHENNCKNQPNLKIVITLTDSKHINNTHYNVTIFVRQF